MLSLMLHRHPRIAIPVENRFVLPVYLGRAEFGDLAEEDNRARLAERIVTAEWFADLQLDPRRITDRIVDEAWTVGAAVGLVLRAYSERNGKLRWGDKRPYYRNTMWAIRTMFPAAQFVHIVRDGRDAVASMATVPPFDVEGFDHRVRTWMEAAENAEQARAKLPADTFYELYYERLVTEPDKELRALCAFLGEKFDEAMLRPEGLADDVVPEYQFWHERTRQEISSRSVGAFREQLEPWQLAVCEAVMGKALREYGYELTGSGPADPEHLEEYARYERRKRKHFQQLRKNDKELDYPWPVADMSPDEARLHRKVARLEKRSARLTRQRDDMRARLDKLVESRSWRWTAPLRTTYRNVRSPRP
ncbi:MAG: sulfotransferase [Streptosporangiales bacterium]|nr:sulfotransferase [Streptosporangiales bacterium]MBO0891888.1 sulfotransferase [Acidothermales bacterium]